MSGTLALSWGPSGGFYVSLGYCKRVCLGRVALTHLPDVEIEELMRSYVNEHEVGSVPLSLTHPEEPR